MSEVTEKLFKDYKDAPWFTHNDAEPDEESKKIMAALMEKLEAYPMEPGNELDFFDDRTPEGITREDIDAPHGLNLYHYTPEKKIPGEDRIIFYVHGGGFMRGNKYWCRWNAIHQAQFLGLPVYACEYRYVPEFKYPSGIDDVEWAWNYLVDTLKIDPKKIIITGESAGGTYEMALLVRLKRQGRELPPSCVCISGFLDYAAESPSYTLNNGIDPLFSIDFSFMIPNYLHDPSIVHDAEVSPKNADVEGFPETIFFVDDTEVFVSDSLILAEKLYKAGIKTEAYITHGLTHCYAFEMPELAAAKVCYDKMKKFLGL